MLVPDVTLLKCYKTKLIARLVLRQKSKIYWPIFQLAELVFFRANFFSCIKYWPWRRLALLVEILANKFCPFAVVPALQSIWCDVWYEHFLTKRSGNNKPSSLIIRCEVSCIQSSYIYWEWLNRDKILSCCLVDCWQSVFLEISAGIMGRDYLAASCSGDCCCWLCRYCRWSFKGQKVTEFNTLD